MTALILDPENCSYSIEALQQLDWSRFSVVKLRRGMPELSFPAVRHSAFGYTALLLQRVFALGYQRVACLLGNSHNPTDDDARLGAVLSFRENHLPPGADLSWHTGDVAHWRLAPRSAAVWQWVDRHRPDALLAFPFSLFYHIQELGWQIPSDFAFASPIVPESPGLEHIAGCDRRGDAIVSRALDLLEKQIILNQRGEQEHPEEVVIDPIWRSGPSLPDRTCPARSGQ